MMKTELERLRDFLAAWREQEAKARAMREQIERDIAAEEARLAAERRVDDLVRERDEAQQMASAAALLYAIPLAQDRYERAYLAALTGLLASGECQSFTSASIDADTCAKLALAAFEARAKERG